MDTRSLPFTSEELADIVRRYPTPFHLYDEAGIRRTARALNDAFTWAPGGFRNYFAVKALPNPAVMRIVQEEGMGFDCSSYPELLLAERLQTPGEQIMFTSNDTPLDEYRAATEMGAILNLDDISHIPFVDDHLGLPDLVCIRYNPGPLKEGNVIIGRPQDAKYGFTREQVFEGYRQLRERGVRRFGLHTMVASNELDPDYFAETARILFELAVDILKELDIAIAFVNLGGGIGIPYKPGEQPVDLQRMAAGIRMHYESLIAPSALDPLSIYMENGRCVTGPHGYLVARVLHIKDTYKRFVGLDASMANLMRPGMYGAHHQITVIADPTAGDSGSHADDRPSRVVDVTGSLCENNDKFAIDRELPEIRVGDLVVIHDTGAHGHSMGFNYNGKLRSAELLLHEDRSVEMIRRAETVDDYFATLQIDRS